MSLQIMGLATIDPHPKSTPRFTKSPSLVLIKSVLTEIERFKNVKLTKKCKAIRTLCSDSVRMQARSQDFLRVGAIS